MGEKMMPGPSLLTLDRTAALVLAIALETELLPLLDLQSVGLSTLMGAMKPPVWLIDLVSARTKEKAIRALDNMAYSPPFENLPERSDLVVAALFLKQQGGRLTWREFLAESGLITDGQPGKRDCEYFYAMLDELEGSPETSLATRQQAGVSCIYSTDIDRVQAALRMAGV